MTNLAIRIITAFVFGTLFILCLFLSPYSLAFIFLLICFFAAKEYYSIHAKILESDDEPIWYLTIFNTCFYLFFVLALQISVWFAIGSLVCFLLPIFMRKQISIIKYWRGILYITIPCIIANIIVLWPTESDFNPLTLMGVFLIVWANDVFAYFIGKYLGKRKLAPKISPNKTVEGFLGGFVGSLAMGFLLSVIIKESYGMQWIVIAVIIGIFGPIGDLIESRIKRKANVKDSGKILPGHGGILDRMDAFFFSVVFVFIYLYFWV